MTGEPYDPVILGMCRNKACRDTHLLGRGPYLISQGAWNALTREHRRSLTGFIARKAGRDMCTACYCRERRAAKLIDHERRTRPAVERAADYETIRAELPGTSSYARARAAGARQTTPDPMRPDDPQAATPAHPDTIRRALRLHGVTP